MKLNKLYISLVLSGSFVSTHAAIMSSGEGYDQTNITLLKSNLDGCLPGIDIPTKQISHESTDIQGKLAFTRMYSTNLQPGLKGEYRTTEGAQLDAAYAGSYLAGEALMGAGWSHNFDYGLQTVKIDNTQLFVLILRLPGSHYPITLKKQTDGKFKIVSNVNDTSPSNDQEILVSEDPLRYISITINGKKLRFYPKEATDRGVNVVENGFLEKYYLEEIAMPGGRKFILDYTPMDFAPSKKTFLLTNVKDNIGNSIKITRLNLNGADTSTYGQKARGFISSVETNANGLQPQKVEYLYNIFTHMLGGQASSQGVLAKATSTMNGIEEYIYNDYFNKGMFSNSSGTTRGVMVPILQKYIKAGQTLRNWEVTDNTIASYTDQNLDYGELKFTEDSMQIVNGKPYYGSSTLTLTQPSPKGSLAINKEVFKVENGTSNAPETNGLPVVLYTSTSPTSCLTYNSKPISQLTFRKDIRQLINIKDKKGALTTIDYDNMNRVTRITKAKGSNVEQPIVANYSGSGPFSIPKTLEFGSGTNRKSITNEINLDGSISKSTATSYQTNSSTIVKDFVYTNSGGLLGNEKTSNPNAIFGPSIEKRYMYDAFGNKAAEYISLKSSLRKTSYLGYNSYGLPERIVYPNGLVDKFIYNADGTIQSKTTGLGDATSSITGKLSKYTYDTLKRVSSETNPDQEVIKYEYDLKNQNTKTTLPDGSILKKTYHGNGQLASSQLLDSSGATIFKQTSTTLDTNGRLLKSQTGNDANKNSLINTYDLNGNLSNTLSSFGISEKWSYDELNRQITHTDGLNKTDTQAYDILDNKIKIKDPLNSGTDPYTYKSGNVLTKEVNSDYGTKDLVYDHLDRLTKITHVDRKCENSNIDEINRIGKVICTNVSGTTPENLLSNLTFNYDQTRFGRLDKVTSADTVYGVNTDYTYDTYDRVIGKSQTNKTVTTWTGSQPTLNISYDYTIGDKLKTLSLPSGRQLVFSYDATKKNQLANITLDGSALIRAISYDAGGQMTGWNWGAGAASYTWAYDPVKTGEIKSINNKNNSGSLNYSLVYDFDNDGRISKLTRNNGLIDSFNYNNADRLIKEVRTNGTTNIFNITYTYDDNGNRLSLTATGTHQQPQANVVYTYTGNKLATIAGATANHTANAELIYGGFTPTYDNAGNRREVKTTGGSTTAPQYYMTYNHKNERTIRGYQANGSAWKTNTIQYIYDESSHLIGEYNADGTPLIEYVWIGDKPVAAIYGSGSTSKTYWIVSDAQNTPRRLIDATDGNTTVWAWDSTAFGVGTPSIETVKFNLRFPGQYYDELTKQHYNHNRFYNPVLGRYMEPDRIGLEGGLNPYIYAGNNPINTFDSKGLDIFNNNNGTMTIRPNIPQAPSLTIPIPNGWSSSSTNLTPFSKNYHEYNYQFTLNGINGNNNILRVQNAIVQKPTPGTGIASKEGTAINASPLDFSTFSQGIRSAGGLFARSPVKSYSVNNEYGTWVYNVTQAGHPLSDGYVLRGAIPGIEGMQIINYGEGNGALQYSSITSGFINRIWIYGTLGNLKSAFLKSEVL
ncbi:RHS repeat domain-containing protein [Acinetobacter courvalinii]|uniref:RHS repeat domain-containing protein n=1 Tax=Acinetobacter courvalinii TaxID=280147 RepID=UPI003A87F549